MTIIQELLSKDGNLRTKTMEDVRSIRRYDNIRVREKTYPGLWVKADREHAITFSTIQLRDAAFSRLQEVDSAVILKLEEYFWDEKLSLEAVSALCNKKASKHLYYQIKNLSKDEDISLVELAKQDAFKSFNIQTLADILAEKPINLVLDYKQVIIWSKTLFTPKEELRLGITPLQFYKTIINNEKNWSINFSE